MVNLALDICPALDKLVDLDQWTTTIKLQRHSCDAFALFHGPYHPSSHPHPQKGGEAW